MATKRKAKPKTTRAAKAKAPAAKQAKARAPTRPGSVDAFLSALDHPLKDEVEIVRQWILSVDPTIAEEVKWNAPSFRTTDFFATFHLRSLDAVQLVFHAGARPKASATTGLGVEAPEGLPLRWLAKDRALVTLGRGAALRAQRRALESLVRQWIAALSDT